MALIISIFVSYLKTNKVNRILVETIYQESYLKKSMHISQRLTFIPAAGTSGTLVHVERVHVALDLEKDNG